MMNSWSINGFFDRFSKPNISQCHLFLQNYSCKDITNNMDLFLIHMQLKLLFEFLLQPQELNELVHFHQQILRVPLKTPVFFLKILTNLYCTDLSIYVYLEEWNYLQMEVHQMNLWCLGLKNHPWKWKWLKTRIKLQVLSLQ
jgi:hypothetical protein